MASLRDTGLHPVRGLVLAGGHSSRLGEDKAALRVDGQTLLARTVGLLQPFTLSVHVSVRADQRRDPHREGFALLFDPAPELGPVGGLLAAQFEYPDAAWLVVACDMPGLGAAHLSALLQARDAGRGGTAFRNPVDGLPEPLCAIWEPATLARLVAQAAHDAARVSPRAILAGADPVLLNSPRPGALASINTPADLDRYWKLNHGQESQEDRAPALPRDG